MSQSPESSIPKACKSWAETKAAYRLFDNPKVSERAILEEHRHRTFERMENEKIVLAIQDTTFLTYGSHTELEGEIGFIATPVSHLKGIIVHSTLAVNHKGMPLGLLDQKRWIREQVKGRNKNSAYREEPVTEKENFRWIQAMKRSHPGASETRVVVVADREADFYELFQETEDAGLGFLIRVTKHRRKAEGKWLHEILRKEEIRGSSEIIRSSDRQKMKVSLRWKTVELEVPKRSSKSLSIELKPLQVQALLVRDESTDEEENEWLLLTNEPIKTIQQACEKVEWYRHRWHIESFHKTLKSGLQVERARFETLDRLHRFLSLCSVLSWRLYWMTHLSRHEPKKSCAGLLDESEVKAIFYTVHENKNIHPPPQPTIHQVVRWIAQLGGFLARKGDGEPGIITVWRGWIRVPDLTRAYEYAISQRCG